MKKDIMRIKKSGRLLAVAGNWQYWECNSVVYSVHVDGLHYDTWCSTDRLARHLHRLYQITGRRFFRDDPDARIINRDYFKNMPYA